MMMMMMMMLLWVVLFIIMAASSVETAAAATATAGTCNADGGGNGSGGGSSGIFTLLISFVAGSLATLAWTSFLAPKFFPSNQKKKNDNESAAAATAAAFTTTTGRNIYNHSRSIDGSGDATSSSSSSSPSGAAAAANDAVIDGSGVFIADLLEHLWHYMNVAICKTVKESVEPMFAQMLPTPLNTLHFTHQGLSLGQVPLRLDHMIVHPVQKDFKTGKSYLQMEMDVCWNGECCIELKADYIGRLGVRAIKFAGRLSIILSPLLEELPIAAAIQYAFISTPTIALDFTGLANLADMQSLKRTIHATIDSILNDMMVLPNRMMIKVAPTVSFVDIYHAPIAILRVAVLRGRGFVEQKRAIRKKDIPDVYCTIQVGNNSDKSSSSSTSTCTADDKSSSSSSSGPWRTSTCPETLTPEWKQHDGQYEFCDFLLYDYNQVIRVEAFDEDLGTLDRDDVLGLAQLTVGDLLLEPHCVAEVELYESATCGKRTGAYITLQAQVVQLTTTSTSSGGSSSRGGGGGGGEVMKSLETTMSMITKERAAVTEGTTPPPAQPEITTRAYCGLLTILVAQANNVPNQPNAAVVAAAAAVATTNPNDVAAAAAVKEEIAKAPTCFVEVTFGTKTKFVTPTMTGTANPAFDAAFCLPLTRQVLQNVLVVASNNNNNNNKAAASPSLASVCFRLLQGKPTDDEEELKCLGSFQVSYDAIMKAPNFTVTGQELMSNSGTATATGGPSLEYSVSLAGVMDAPTAAAASGFQNALSSRSNDTAASTGSSSTASLVRITIVKAWGFQVEKRGLRKGDVPDVYCQVRFGSSPTVWRTSTIENSLAPQWDNEKDASSSQTFTMIHPRQVVQLNVWDEDTGKTDEDDALGSARVSIGKLLLAGCQSNVELELHGKPTGAFVSLKCEVLGRSESSPSLSPTPPPQPLLTPTSWKLPTGTGPVAKKNVATKGSPVRLTVIKGWGFQVQTKRLTKDDVPDVYVKIKLLEPKKKNKQEEVWTTSTVQNNVAPEWNESHVIYMTDRAQQNVLIHAYDKDAGAMDLDDDLGSALVSMDRLLRSATDELGIALLHKDGKPTGSFISIRCCAVVDGSEETSSPSATGAETAPTANETAVHVNDMGRSPVVEETSSVKPSSSSTTVEKVMKSEATDSAGSATTGSDTKSDGTKPDSVKQKQTDPTIDDKKDSAFNSATTTPEHKDASISLTVVKGRGFQIQKFRLKKNDVPDVYCKIKILGTTNDVWRTSTIANNVSPEWHESRTFNIPHGNPDETIIISMDVMDEDSGRHDDDDFLGKASISARDLLSAIGGMVELELRGEDGKPNGFVTLSCVKFMEHEEFHA